ncbi:uncharacterized protein LOC119645371 [Glossina fuscipes]|uniref:Uncharacterized protein LOC119645371 n=1 Tax=Glossina fuscipes TaxID=7396 RepID=A0A9C5ZKL4_9MUSC|nr:uncharacterized protein LOC119645371 [Glossina fuscipes]
MLKCTSVFWLLLWCTSRCYATWWLITWCRQAQWCPNFFFQFILGLLAILNPSTSRRTTINKLRDIIATPGEKIKLLWVPGHIGLLGNEQADRAAKYAASVPLFMNDVKETLDLQGYIGRRVKEKITEGNLQ